MTDHGHEHEHHPEPLAPVEARRARVAHAARGDGYTPRERGRDPRVGLERRGPVSRAAGTAFRHRRHVRRRAGLDRVQGFDDRGGPIVSVELPDEVSLMDGDSALPRDNGELVFAAPWEARAVAMAVALVDRLGLPWDEFRTRLIR